MSGTVLVASHMSFQSTLIPVNEVDITHFTAAESKILQGKVTYPKTET